MKERNEMRTTMLTRHDDMGCEPYDSIAWAFETKVRTIDNRAYNSAVLYGNEDAPSRIEFYLAAEPLVTDTPAFVWMHEER